MSAARRNGRRTIFCWCKSACAKAPAAQEKPVRTLSAQKNAGRFAPGSPYIFRALCADAPRKRPHTAQKRSVFLYAVSCCDKCAGKYTVFSVTFAVVPRKGDVDRNDDAADVTVEGVRVVPRKGDVDRNERPRGDPVDLAGSSPARGTWIEIAIRAPSRWPSTSSPARGTWIEMTAGQTTINGGKSSPARGTWIEMYLAAGPIGGHPVVPRKGDVDRNLVQLA